MHMYLYMRCQMTCNGWEIPQCSNLFLSPHPPLAVDMRSMTQIREKSPNK